MLDIYPWYTYNITYKKKGDSMVFANARRVSDSEEYLDFELFEAEIVNTKSNCGSVTRSWKSSPSSLIRLRL
ncbi:hypothetical protein FHS18_003219 [Paenibacillus phyllosphaerae]|uniref:Uncharacterized protein n=1 Tax=Paenibacillus phyllosphaerae TaxID=274593 RepID=A0A7W5AZJ1_9BACL|nr:hypothetical protein [Paenibacillus phyllosphaerae]